MTPDEIRALAQKTVLEDECRARRKGRKEFYDKVFLATLAAGRRDSFSETFDLVDRYLKARDKHVSETEEP